MPELDTDLLTESLVEALETMAFISPMPWEGDLPTAPHMGYAVSIRHHTDQVRTCRLIAPGEFAEHLAANLLGDLEPGQDPVVRNSDALKELMNVVSGAMLRAADAHSTATLAIDLPQVEIVHDANAWSRLIGEPGAIQLNADGFLLVLTLSPGA